MKSILLALAAFSLPVFSAEPLKVGSPAPKLQTGEWIQGEPVKEFAKAKKAAAARGAPPSTDPERGNPGILPPTAANEKR